MVSNITKVTVVGFLLTIVIRSQLSAQENKEYPVLQKYRKISLMVGPAIYNRAQTYPQYGSYTLTNKPIPGYNAGINYDFQPDKKWSFITGLWFAKEPIYSIHNHIYKNDIYSNFEEDYISNAKAYAMFSFSAPLLLRFNLQTSSKSFINFLTGFKIMYFPYGSAEYGLIFHNEDNTESREVFAMRLESQEFPLYGSFIVGTGGSIALRKMLVKMNIIYVMNYPNTIEGEYQFGNLFSSPPTRGDYKLSGNYVTLQFSVNFRNPKHKWLKVNLKTSENQEPINLNK